MRQYLAWPLVLILAFQQMAGRIYVNIAYSVEAASVMNDREREIATSLSGETGIEAYVEIRDAQKLSHLYGLGYGTPFVFSEEISGEVNYFTVENTPAATGKYVYALGGQADDEKKPEKKAFLDRLVPDFCCVTAALPSREAPDSNTPRFSADEISALFAISIPTPPPDRSDTGNSRKG